MAYKLTNHDTLKNMNITNNNDDRKQLIKVVTITCFIPYLPMAS